MIAPAKFQATVPAVAVKVEAPPPREGTVEHHALEFGTPEWVLAGARAMHRWPVGAEVSAVDYIEACDAVTKIEVR